LTSGWACLAPPARPIIPGVFEGEPVALVKFHD
jgi:hypothetical protein